MLKFTQRKELAQITRMLCYSKTAKSIYYKVSGKSGSGKTELIKKAVETVCKSDSLFIYVDVINDEFQSTSFFSTLLENVYFPLSHRYDTINNIPENVSLSKYTKKIFRRHHGIEKVLNTSAISASAIPAVGGPISMIMDKWIQERTTSIDNLLFLYFKYIIKKTRINLIVDNYQFLPENIKRTFETGINQFDMGITLVIIDRIKENPTHEQSFCTSFQHDFLDLDYISYEEYVQLIENQSMALDASQKKKIWDITKGNLKDIDIIVNELRINPGYDIISNKIAIQNLDDIQRSILIIASIFPAGMKEGYVIKFIRSILNETEEDKIKDAIIKLTELGYIYKNSNTHDTIKPTHETVINRVKEAIDLQDFTLFQASLSDSLEELAENYHGTKDYSYLLHCWVGINSFDKLRKKSSYVQELISIKYKENAYYYIDLIATEIRDVIVYLPESCVEKILIAFQRVSDFSNGISILNNMRSVDTHLYHKFQIFSVKFLIQTYEFEEALNQLNDMPDSSAKLLCETNALQHLGRDNEVLKLLNTRLPKCEHNEDYYIILRNTAHYFTYEKARANLMSSLKFFEQSRHTAFATATIQNNLSVINIWYGRYDEAADFLESAIGTLELLHSNEVFEPYCNKSILCLRQRDYTRAYEYAQKALANCPKALTLDIIMLKINIIIIELCQQVRSIEDSLTALNLLVDEYPMIEDPWYEFQLLYNIKQLALMLHHDGVVLKSVHERYVTEYRDSKTKFYILEQLNIKNLPIELCLGLSPNWRY